MDSIQPYHLPSEITPRLKVYRLILAVVSRITSELLIFIMLQENHSRSVWYTFNYYWLSYLLCLTVYYTESISQLRTGRKLLYNAAS